MKSLPVMVAPALLSSLVAAAPPTIRVGLDTQATEWVVSLEGGGELRGLDGTPLLRLESGEKVRIWWDSLGKGDPTDEYRVQVGGPWSLQDAENLMKRLRLLGEAPDRLPIPDGGSWRVLTGHFTSPAAAEPLLEKLGHLGFQELWVATEPRPGKPGKGRALYAVTERYERRPLPSRGVELVPKLELTTLAGKGRYRGRIAIFPNAQGRLTVVNTLDLETYLRGVVPKEMGAWEYPALEALKAQAVAARTYAYSNRGKRGGEGFDLLDTIADQVYGGRDGEQNLTDRAVSETAGLIATYGGKPIQALFMANGGGATVDNAFVFGNGHPYLQGVSNYASAPQTRTFRGVVATSGDAPWLTWELLRLAALGGLPAEELTAARLGQPARTLDLRPALDLVATRLGRPRAPISSAGGPGLYLWMARALGFQEVVEGLERPQDAAYFLGDALPAPGDQALAAFLVRRGLLSPGAWRNPAPTFGQALQTLGRLWNELEPLEWQEGTLLRDGQVRVKNGGPGPLSLAPGLLLAEEAPGGSLRLVKECAAQVGDRLRWLPLPEGSPLLVRRLDPDGASLDRYNPTAHWKAEIKEADLLSRLGARAAVASIDRLELTHNDQGRVLEMRVVDGKGRRHLFKGMRLRSLMGLKDNVFRLLCLGQAPDWRWIAYGRGWGHGVGMDQSGAYGMALEGAGFEGILKHYYQGIQLTSIKD
jgi:stage II sporulation protein D